MPVVLVQLKQDFSDCGVVDEPNVAENSGLHALLSRYRTVSSPLAIGRLSFSSVVAYR